MKRLLPTTVCLLVMSSVALAQATTGMTGKQIRKHRYGSISCGSDPILPTDGSTIQDFVTPSSASYYLVHLKDGHSYSAEVYDPVDATISAAAQLVLLSATGCSPLSTTDVVNVDPDLSNAFSDRISWVQSGDADAVLEVINPDSANTYSYNIRIVDTTLRNARWSTVLGGAFSTHYGFLNTTESAIQGTLTLYASDGQIYTASFTIPAAGEVFQTVCGTGSAGCSAQNIEVPSNKAGFATFAFIGPPGAVTVDGYFQGVVNGVFVMVPTAWSSRNSQH